MSALARIRGLPLAALLAAATAFVAWFGLRIHGLVIFDEKLSVEGARYVAGDLARLWEMPGYADRGIERLTGVLLVPVFGWLPAGAGQWVAGHILMAALFALQGLAAWLLARGLGAGAWWRLAAASLSVAGPWAVFGTTFLNTVPAATTAVFAIWAIWRAVLEPSPARDALALGLLALSALSRVSHAGLAVAFPVAILVQAWRDRAAGEPARTSLAQVPLRAARAHPLLVAAGAAAIALVAAKGSALVGNYPSGVDASPDRVMQRLRATVGHLGAGTAIVPVAVGLGWLTRQALRPTAREAGAFAVVTLTAVASLLFVNLPGGFDERYDVPLVVPLATAFAVAAARREIGLVPTAGAALVTLVLFHGHGLTPFVSPTDHLNHPSALWFSRVVVGRTAVETGIDPGVLRALFAVAMAALAIALALARGAAGRRLAAIVAVGAIAFAATGAGWAMKKLSDGYRPQLSFADLTFADRVAEGLPVLPLAHPQEPDSAIPNLWSELQYFNGAIPQPLALQEPSYPLCCRGFGYPITVPVDDATGAIPRADAVPPLVLMTPRWTPRGLATRRVMETGKLGIPVRVERVERPPRLAWVGRGLDPWGWARPGSAPVLRLFPGGAPSCLTATVRAPLLPPGRTTAWRLGTRRGRLAGGSTVRVTVPLAGRRPRDLPLRGGPAGRDPETRTAALVGLADLRVSRCPAS